MKTIKFRAWDTEEKKMIYQIYQVDNKSKKDDKFEVMVIDFEGNPLLLIENRVEDTAKVRTFYNGQLKIMQFTGLRDKNGYEIYEGDIVKNSWGEIGVIKFEDACFEVDWGKNSDCDDLAELSYKEKIEVIGNIYENPEFLKRGA